MGVKKKTKRGGHKQKLAIEHNGLYPYLLRYLEVSRIEGMSEATITRRDSALRQFILWCDEFGLNEPQSITKPILERYQRHLYYYRKADGDPLSASSQNVALSAIKMLFRWLARENYLLYNPASELRIPKRSKQLPRYILSIEQVMEIQAQADLQTASGVRDRTILELLYATGVRRTELCELRVDGIDYERCALLIRSGKGNKDRYVPTGERAAAWLRRYTLEVRSSLLTDLNDVALFLTDYGEPYTSSSLGRMVKRYIKQADIDVTGSCHLFRHAMATHMLENGADVRYIQAILGHSGLETTQIYTHVSINQLQHIHASTHPSCRKP